MTGPNGISTVIHSFAKVGNGGGNNGGGTNTGPVAGAPTITPIGITFTTKVNQAFVGAVGGFKSSDTALPASAFSAYIDYGDTGGFAGNVIQVSPGVFNVVGGHAYTYPGTAFVSIRILGPGGSGVYIRSVATLLA